MTLQEVDKLREKWNRFELVEGFQKLRANSLLLAIWDDHDYGKNDAGGEFPAKAGSQEVFLDFLNEPKDSIRRKTPGIYDCVTIGPIGKRVQFILLDTRYFRTPLKRAKIRKAGNGPYEPNFLLMPGYLEWINGDGLKNNFKYLLISESSRQASKSYHRIMGGKHGEIFQKNESV